MRRANRVVELRFKDNGASVYDSFRNDEHVYERRPAESWDELVNRALNKHQEICLTEAHIRDNPKEDDND